MGLRGPKPVAGERREITLRIRLAPEERAELDRVAETAGQGTSTWARDVLLAAARKPSPKKAAKKK